MAKLTASFNASSFFKTVGFTQLHRIIDGHGGPPRGRVAEGSGEGAARGVQNV